MLYKHSHVPLYIQLKDELLGKIKQGVWNNGSQIPTEKALMAEYDVGRATIREAISILENEGYLYKKHGIGTFVASSQPSFGFEPLISLTYSLNAKGINAKNVIEEKGIIEADRHVQSKMRSKHKNVFYLRRLRYAEGIPIAIEDSYFGEDFLDISEKHDLSGSLAKILLKDLNVTIKKVEQTIVPRIPTEREQQILHIDGSVRVLDMERWIYIQNSKDPFYYLNFIISSNIYSLSLY